MNKGLELLCPGRASEYVRENDETFPSFIQSFLFVSEFGLFPSLLCASSTLGVFVLYMISSINPSSLLGQGRSKQEEAYRSHIKLLLFSGKG